MSQFDKNSAYATPFNVFEVRQRLFLYPKIWNEFDLHLFEKLTREPIKEKGKYMHSKLKKWKERIKTNFCDQNVLYDMYCKATVLLKNDFVYKKNKSYHPQVNVKECKKTDAESQQCALLRDSYDDDGCFKI